MDFDLFQSYAVTMSRRFANIFFDTVECQATRNGHLVGSWINCMRIHIECIFKSIQYLRLSNGHANSRRVHITYLQKGNF